jgi:hypothetical protein
MSNRANIVANGIANPCYLVDSNGYPITSLSDGSIGGQNGLAVSMAATNFVLSPGNTTTAQLASNATFPGAIETIYSQQTISVIMTSDQPGTLTLNQYIDAAGSFKISSWSFPIAANTPFSRSFTANGNYFNLAFQNTGASTTTTLNISTAYGTLFPATNLGNVPVALNEVNGASLSLSNPLPAADPIRGYTLAGQAFVATTGSITAGSSNTFGACVFHPATNAKNMLIYSARLSNNGGSSMAYLYNPATNPALGNACTVNNLLAGGSASSIASANITYATSAASAAGTLLETMMVPQSSVTELLPGGFFVPASTAGGIAIYDYIASGAAWTITVRWIEF